MCLACALSLSPSPSLSLSLYYRIYKVLSEYQVLSAAASTHTHTPSIMIMETLKQLYCNNNKKVTSSDSCIYWEPHTHTSATTLSLSLVRPSHNCKALLRYTYVTRNCASITTITCELERERGLWLTLMYIHMYMYTNLRFSFSLTEFNKILY